MRRFAWIAVLAALALSAGLNFFLLGVITASPPSDARAVLAETYPPEIQAAIRREIRGEGLAWLRDFRRWRQARRAALGAMKAKPYDAETVAAHFAESRVIAEALLTRFHDAVLRAVEKADDEARAKIKERPRLMERIRKSLGRDLGADG